MGLVTRAHGLQDVRAAPENGVTSEVMELRLASIQRIMCRLDTAEDPMGGYDGLAGIILQASQAVKPIR